MIVAVTHPWWPHLFSFPRFLDIVSWWWLSVKGYALTSSWFQVTFITGALLLYRKHNCHAPLCPRLGHHPTADGLHHLCRKHHPDLPNHRLSLDEIHRRHHDAR